MIAPRMAKGRLIINAAFLRERRVELGLSLAEVAERAELGGGRQYLYSLEHGRRTMVNADVLHAIAKALRVRMETLLTDATPNTPSPTEPER